MMGRRSGMRAEEMYGMGGLSRRDEDLDDMEMMRMRMKRFDGPGGRREEDLDDMEMMRMRMKQLDEGPSSMGAYDDDFNDMEMMRRRMDSLDDGYPGMSGYRRNRGMDEEMYRESQRYEDDMDGGFQTKGFQSRFGDNFSSGFGGGIYLRDKLGGSSAFEKARQKLSLKDDPMDAWM